MTRRLVQVAFVVVCSAAFVACAAQPARVVMVTSAPTSVAPTQTTGVWDWVFRSVDDQGDMRVEQEEWHLQQSGAQIDGYYDRAVTMLSTDERLFRCNQRLGFTKVTRVHLAGTLAGAQVQLREIGFEAKPGPCDDGARSLVEYKGVINGPTMALHWGPAVSQTLVRRSEEAATSSLAGFGTAPSFASAPPGGATTASATAGMSQALDGNWTWELRSIDAEGDERLEREDWHLQETPTGISGYYTRHVKKVRGDGTFACNGEARFDTDTRYDLVGQRLGDRISLSEIDYKAAPSHCDNALRRLDTYEGHFADRDSLILSWGPGNQLLHRTQQ